MCMLFKDLLNMMYVYDNIYTYSIGEYLRL